MRQIRRRASRWSGKEANQKGGNIVKRVRYANVATTVSASTSGILTTRTSLQPVKISVPLVQPPLAVSPSLAATSVPQPQDVSVMDVDDPMTAVDVDPMDDPLENGTVDEKIKKNAKVRLLEDGGFMIADAIVLFTVG